MSVKMQKVFSLLEKRVGVHKCTCTRKYMHFEEIRMQKNFVHFQWILHWTKANVSFAITMINYHKTSEAIK